MPKVNVSAAAYTKILLHASKYPYAPIGGFVISSDKEGESVSLCHDLCKIFLDFCDQISVIDVVPVFHMSPVGPVMDIAAIIVCS